ncbi:Uncharacterized protein TCM_018704 [Theobroma cacao]|uniref:RNase H type-1 domain-containing protein n=1 Tax=Theobroma cacao TaxID=3641 RepID=A0A061EMQ4_THECC|nr:Uncharacterized protein TCM_018704 [Theobroma cacao]
MWHTRIDLQVHDKMVVKAITSSLSYPCSNFDLIQAIQYLMQHEWELVTHHVVKEDNEVVDYMVNKTLIE